MDLILLRTFVGMIPIMDFNVRDKPDLGGIILGILPLNTTEVAVGACASGSCPVQCKNLKGWSRDRYLAERLETLRTVKGISANSPRGLVLRNGPDQTCSAVATVPYNAQDIVLHVCETSPLDPTSTWCLLTYNQNSGWAPADHLEAQHKSPPPNPCNRVRTSKGNPSIRMTGAN